MSLIQLFTSFSVLFSHESEPEYAVEPAPPPPPEFKHKYAPDREPKPVVEENDVCTSELSTYLVEKPVFVNYTVVGENLF